MIRMSDEEIKSRLKEKYKAKGFEILPDVDEDHLQVSLKEGTAKVYIGNVRDNLSKMPIEDWDKEMDRFVGALEETHKEYKKKGKLTFRVKPVAFLEEAKAAMSEIKDDQKRLENELIVVDEQGKEKLGLVVLAALETDNGYMYLSRNLAKEIGEDEKSLKAKFKKMMGDVI